MNLREIGYLLVDNDISTCLNELCLKYENIILMDDLNSTLCEERMDTYYFKNSKITYRSIENPSCDDLMSSNKSLCFH